MTDSGSDPAVSVIIAAYNGAAFIGETLACMRAQTFADFEIVVVDDRSTDDTLALLRAHDDPRLTIVASEVNQGPVAARNRAFALARGRYFAALDQDDLCHSERFARQVAYLDGHPDVVLVGTAAAELGDRRIAPRRSTAVTTPGLIGWLIQLQNPLVWSSVMFRADAARRLDPISRPEILYAEDFDLYHRLRAFGALARIDEELTTYRRHAGGASQRHHASMMESATRVLAEAHRPVFGEDAQASAELVVRHIMGGRPAQDVDRLVRMAWIIGRLRDHAPHRETRDPVTDSLIREAAARLWWHVADTSIRSGCVALNDVLAVRPIGMPMIDGLPARLLKSGVIGTSRSLLRRRAA